MSRKNEPVIDKRDIPVDTEILEHIADCHAGGSGSGEYITGRIQSMARELLEYRKGKMKL